MQIDLFYSFLETANVTDSRSSYYHSHTLSFLTPVPGPKAPSSESTNGKEKKKIIAGLILFSYTLQDQG